MHPLLLRFWNDEQFFTRWGSGVVYLLGQAISSGRLPTFIDGLGPELGPLVQGLALMIATGTMKLPRVSETTVTATATTIVEAPKETL